MNNELPKQSEAIQTSIQQVSKVLVELLVYGVESDKEKISNFMQELQQQIVRSKQSRRVRVLFYIDKGEKSDDEKKQWLIENSVCKYYIIINPREEAFKGFLVPKDYVRNCMKNIKMFEESFDKMKQIGVTIKKNK